MRNSPGALFSIAKCEMSMRFIVTKWGDGGISLKIKYQVASYDFINIVLLFTITINIIVHVFLR